MEGDELTFTITAAAASFIGTISADELSGEWSQAGQVQSLVLVRGPYVPPPTVVLSDQAMQQLAGTWQGTVNDTELVFRFEQDGDGNFGAFLDIPSLEANGLPVSNINVDGDNFSFGVGSIGAQFTGTLSGNEATGDWARAGNTDVLTISKTP